MENRFTPLVNQTPEKTLDLVNQVLKQMGLPEIKKRDISLNIPVWRKGISNHIWQIKKDVYEKTKNLYGPRYHEQEKGKRDCAELHLIANCISLNSDKISYSKAEIKLWGFTTTPYLLSRNTGIPRHIIDSFVDEIETNEPHELAYYVGGNEVVMISEKKITEFRTRYLSESTKEVNDLVTFSININKQVLLEMISNNEPFVITISGPITQQIVASKEKQLKFLSTPLYDLDMSVRSYNRLASLRLIYPFELAEYLKTDSNKEIFMNQARGFGVKSREEVGLMFRQSGLDLYHVSQEIIDEARTMIKV